MAHPFFLNITAPPKGLKPTEAAIKANSVGFAHQRFVAAFAFGPEVRSGWVGARQSRRTARFEALCAGLRDLSENRPNGFQADLAGRTVAWELVNKPDLPPTSATRPRFCALAANGAWAIELSQDAGVFAACSVRHRCNALAYPDSLLPDVTADSSLCHRPIVFAPERRDMGSLRSLCPPNLDFPGAKAHIRLE